MHSTRPDMLRVPGAQLAYERRGSGPLLLLIAGGSGNSSAFTGIANLLADRYTVVTYNRRGAGKSLLDDPSTDDKSIERHGDDALALLSALTTEPVAVFGSSAGGLVGLDLVARYPEKVRLLVAHEPTVPGVCPAFDQSQERHLETALHSGALAALAELSAENGGIDEEWEAGVELPPSDPQAAMASAEMLFTQTVPAILRYRLDLPALALASSKIVLAGGDVGHARDTLVYQCTAALAMRLGTDVVEFPGNHTGCISRPRAFSQRLSEVLGAEPVA